MNFDQRVAERDERMVERSAGKIVFNFFDRQTTAGRHDVVFRELSVADPNVFANDRDVASYRFGAGCIARGDWRECFAFVAGGDVVDFDLAAIGRDD